MTQEARRFVADLVWGDRNFTEFFTAGYGHPNGDLARIYGVDPPATDFDRVPSRPIRNVPDCWDRRCSSR